MKLVIFGLSISSSWGNGHATLWRGLCRALKTLGHFVVFFEHDEPYYAQHRDLHELPNGKLILYASWKEVQSIAARHLRDADVAIVTSYCPDGIAASNLILDSPAPLHVFYDLDTPVTLARLAAGETVDYIPPQGLRDFDLVLSYTGGRSIDQLRQRLGAGRIAPLYGSVDPDTHRPAAPDARYSGELGYLGTYAADRDDMLTKLFVEPSRRRPAGRFLLAGSQYGTSFPWQPNIFYLSHLSAAQHSAFYCSTRLTLNVTRRAMRDTGFCPSGRLFEAAASGAALLSDSWEGLDSFFEPGAEILIANETDEALDALDRSPEELARIAGAARERTLAKHTSMARAIELEGILAGVMVSPGETAGVV